MNPENIEPHISEEGVLQEKGGDSRKRTSNGVGSNAKRNKIAEGHQLKNNFLSLLNEKRKGLEYVLESQEGPDHSPVFVISVEIDDVKFLGKGKTKKAAKHLAAEKAWNSIMGLQSKSDSTSPSKLKTIPDELKKSSGNMKYIDSGDRKVPEKTLTDNENLKLVKQRKTEELQGLVQANTYRAHRLSKKNPLALLNELRPNLKYELIKTTLEITGQKFFISVDVDGKAYNGSGLTIQSAKADAAKSALSEMREFQVKSQVRNVPIPTSIALNESDKVFFDVPKTFANRVSNLIHDTFENAIKMNPKISDWKVLAGIVMTTDKEMSNMEVICISTGAGVIKGENLSFNGASLNDCHAEIVARRCLKHFFWHQLDLHLKGKNNLSIFQKNSTKFQIKPNIKFHFYATSIPCGEVSLFSIQKEYKDVNLTTTDHGLGMLRSKSEFGVIAVGSYGNEQKSSSIWHKQENIHIMSCSDKMTTWNILGVQGSLLNYFIEPVYLDTFIFGQPFHGYHMLHCMFKRIENLLIGLPASFSLHKPKIAYTSNRAANKIQDVPKKSCNWIGHQNNVEIVVTNTGKPLKEDGPVSRLSKRVFFQVFSNLKSLLPFNSSVPQTRWYNKTKQGCIEYNQAKEVVINAFSSNGLGHWKKKPDEQDVFDIVF